jgi:TonB-dependent starch-binding outer membrane protein SusC
VNALSRSFIVVLAVTCVHSTAWASGSAAAFDARAQAVATITGQVVDARTARPLSGVQVHIPGTAHGAFTDREGRYVLPNVPAGEHVIRVQLIGYARADQAVTVRAGEPLVQDFELALEALALDELVVTGAAGQARRREVGNTISQINMADIVEPQSNVDALLQGRAAGVTVLQSTGLAGSGSQIRLRGNVSAALSNQPLVYIDGVRVRSDGYPVNRGDRTSRGPNDRASPLN